MRNFSIKKENMTISVTFLLIFMLSIYHQQETIVVSIFAYLFLISTFPILISLFTIILNNTKNNSLNYSNDYINNSKNIVFDWSNHSVSKIRNSDSFKKIENTFFINQPNNACYCFLNKLFEIDKKSTLKLIFIDYNGINLSINEFQNNLLCRVFTKNDNLSTLFNKVISEMNHRYDLLLKKGVKKYSDYNKKSRDLKEVLLIINEVDEIVNNIELRNSLIRILMHGKDVGIKVVMFSISNKDSINLNCFNDLLSVYEYFDTSLLNKS